MTELCFNLLYDPGKSDPVICKGRIHSSEISHRLKIYATDPISFHPVFNDPAYLIIIDPLLNGGNKGNRYPVFQHMFQCPEFVFNDIFSGYRRCHFETESLLVPVHCKQSKNWWLFPEK